MGIKHTNGYSVRSRTSMSVDAWESYTYIFFSFKHTRQRTQCCWSKLHGNSTYSFSQCKCCRTNSNYQIKDSNIKTTLTFSTHHHGTDASILPHPNGSHSGGIVAVAGSNLFPWLTYCLLYSMVIMSCTF